MEHTHAAELAAVSERAEHAFGLAFQFTGPWMQRTTLRQWQRHRRSAGATISRRAQQRSCRGQANQRPHLSACARILRRARGRHAQPDEGSPRTAWTPAPCRDAVSYTHLTLPTNREV